MKKFLPLALIVFTFTIFSAQAQVAERSTIQSIPVVNGKVTFEETIPAEGHSKEEIKKIIDTWVKERFVKPTVISAKQFMANNPMTTIVKGEEYIVFKNKPLVLERARIYYYLTLTANDGSCTFNMSRITYWYDDEDDKGGLKMIAEEWITDENAINRKGKLKKFEGKFRNKTLELKNILIGELTEKLK